MSELSAGLLALEVQERAAFHRDRARREQVGVVRDERPRRRLFQRVRREA